LTCNYPKDKHKFKKQTGWIRVKVVQFDKKQKTSWYHIYHYLILILSDRGGRHVAVKIVKNVDRYCEAARSEIQVLEHLNTTDPHSTL
jgi:hypothetical protein